MNTVRVDDWTARRVIIASNVDSVGVDFWTVERAIIASNISSDQKVRMKIEDD